MSNNNLPSLSINPSFPPKRKSKIPKTILSATCTAIVTFCALLAGCGHGRSNAWQTAKKDASLFPAALWRDTTDLVRSREHMALLILAGGVSGYTRCAHDDQIADHFEDHHTFGRDFTIGVGTIGNPITHFALAGSGYVYGLLADEQPTRDVSRAALEALSLTGLLTTSLKLIAQDHGPNNEILAWPSGHTSSTVALATVLYDYYGPAVGIPLYALSGFVMYERMDTDEHWASDLIFGAALGYTVARTVTGNNPLQIMGMDVLPYHDPQSMRTGIALARQF